MSSDPVDLYEAWGMLSLEGVVYLMEDVMRGVYVFDCKGAGLRVCVYVYVRVVGVFDGPECGVENGYCFGLEHRAVGS